MVLVNTLKLKHLPNKLTRYSSMNIVTPRIMIVVQVFESHDLQVAAGARASTHSYIHRELSSLFKNRYIPGPHVHLSVHVVRMVDYEYLTIIPQARMGYESIAHEAEGRMGY